MKQSLNFDNKESNMKSRVNIDSNTVLEVKNLIKTYMVGKGTVTALNKVNLKIKKGELVAIVGPSGSGKTTLINCLGALDFPDSGRIIYNIDGNNKGLDITKMNNKQQKEMRLTKIGLIFQFYNLFPILTAYENVELPTVINRNDSKARKERVQYLLKIVGLEKRMHHLPTQMSGGEQQRVTIARALVNKPLIILADEPTGELDTDTTTSIMKIFLELKKNGESILMVTHNRRIAEVADRIISLKDGKIVGEREGGIPLEKIYNS